MRRSLRALWRQIAIVLLVAPCFGQHSSENSLQNPLEQLSVALQRVVAKTSPAIVELEVTGYSQSGDRDDDEEVARGRGRTEVLTKTHKLGSGVILDSKGYIITNAHVLEGARRVQVALDESLRKWPGRSAAGRKSLSFDAKIIGTFEEADLALVKIDATGLPTIPVADSDNLQPGQVVFTVGNPEGLRNSVSMGVISAVGRVSDQSSGATYIQTDAAINSGSSGGALVDLDGKLVGITTFIVTEGGGSEGLGFALPSKLVYSVFQNLKDTGHVHYGDIGIRVQNVTAALAGGLQLPQEWGIIVSDVASGSPAEKAGVQVQDIILSLDGNSLSSSPQFVAAFYNKKQGDRAQLELVRGPHRFVVEVPVLDHEVEPEKSADSGRLESGLVPKLGVMCVPLSQADLHSVPALRSDSGLMVVAKLASGEDKADLISGDVVRSVNGGTVTSVNALRSIIDKLAPGDSAVLQIERRGQFRYITIEIN
jgi:serine protease Do